MSLRTAIIPYMDEDGLVIERPNQSNGPETGNGMRERCVLEMLCFKRGETSPAHLEDFSRVMKSCQVTERIYLGMGKYSNDPIKGLYHRGPRKTDELAAHDDRRCLSAVASVLNLPFAKEIHDYGKKHWWSFNNLKPGKFTLNTFDYRFPGVVPAYRLQAGHKLYPLEGFALVFAFLSSAFSKDPGQKIIWWLNAEALYGKIASLDAAIDQWRNSIKVQYGGLKGLFSAYYNNEKHPFAVYSEHL